MQNCPHVELKEFSQRSPGHPEDPLLWERSTWALDVVIQTTTTDQTLNPLMIAWLRGEMRTG